MMAVKVQDTLNQIERNMVAFAPHRAPALYNRFLVQGYTAITLNSVSQDDFSDLLRAKLCLGTLITLYDDFADRPSQSDPQLLEDLYQLNFGGNKSLGRLKHDHHPVLVFALSLFKEMETVLQRLPHYQHLNQILGFDLSQFYTANRYSSLVTANPFIGNPAENRAYAHHNMGMVLVSMMDLMASENLDLSELGAMREVFLMGQRMGRIFNVLVTRKREIMDGDITSELASYSSEHETAVAIKKLRQEICDLREKILTYDSRIKTFSVKAFVDGLNQVQTLHEKMEGTI